MLLLTRMLLLLLLLTSLLGRVCSTATCTYYNQDTANVIVQKNSVTGVTVSSSITINEGESISISCTNSATEDFVYNTPTDYLCPTGGEQDIINLPICVAKCLKAQDLHNSYTTFLDPNNVTVSNTALAAQTPLTIQCAATYAQSFGKSSEQQCEVWDDDALCKKMCALSAYDTATTRVDANAMGRIDDYLRIGYDIVVSCYDTDASLPDGATSTIKCYNSEDIAVPSCTAMCTVPTPPDGTVYHNSQDKLKEGQTFTVTCDLDLKLPYLTGNIVTCQGSAGFDTIPECKETCTVTASGNSTILSKEINGLLAEGESVRVSCANENDLLPYGYSTPYDLVCNLTKTQTFNIPICQSTCAEPAQPDNSQLYRVSAKPRLSLHEPVQVLCNDYYSFAEPQGSEEQFFYCTDTQAGASVVIDKACYVYAKLVNSSAGTHQLNVAGKIDDGQDHSGVEVKITVTNSTGDVVATVTTVPDTQEVVVLERYDVLEITVETTSQGSNVISRTFSNVYPGPPSPFVVIAATNSTAVTIDLAKPNILDVIDEDTLNNNLEEYIVEYNGNTIPTTQSSIILDNLAPATNYTVKTTTVLTEEYGGRGSPASFQVYTGPSPVTTMTYVVREKEATITWSSVASADQYVVTISEANDNEHTTRFSSDTQIVINDLIPGTIYNVTIKANRKVNVSGADMEISGDVFSDAIESGPVSPNKAIFKVTNTSDDVTISLESANESSRKRRATDPAYVVFLNNERNETFTDNVKIPLELSTTYEIKIAKAVGNDGYGEKAFLTNVDTADCGSIQCVNCESEDYFSYVEANTEITVRCSEKMTIKGQDSSGNTIYSTELKLTCNEKNQYVLTNDISQIYSSYTTIECTVAEAVIVVPTDYTIFYILGGVGVFLILVILIIIIVLRKRRTQGSYNAKKVKESTKKGTNSPDVDPSGPQAFVDDSAYFENKWSNELLAQRPQSGRSKGTSYGSQELRMEIADSDSGITEDLENTYFNPGMYSSKYDDDAISTKSALV